MALTEATTGHRPSTAITQERTINTSGKSPSGASWTHSGIRRSDLFVPHAAEQLPENIVTTVKTLLSDRSTVASWVEKTPLVSKQIAAYYRSLPPSGQESFRQNFNSFLEESHANKYKAAHLLVQTNNEIAKTGTEDIGEKMPTIHSLAQILTEGDFDTVGKIIQQGKATRESVIELAKKALPDASPIVVDSIIDAFTAVGAVSQMKPKDPSEPPRLQATNKQRPPIYASVVAASQAALTLIPPSRSNAPVTSFENIIDAHEDAAEGMKVDTISVGVNKPSIKVLTLTESMFGYNSSDPKFFARALETAAAHKETKPDVVVVSGILFGGHEYREKTLKGVTSMDVDRQFQTAKFALSEVAKKTGAVVVYSMGDNDHEVARDIALNALRTLRKTAGKLGKPGDFLSIEQQDQLIRDPEFIHHLRVATNIMYEYCLRAGRSLRSKEEMERLTKSKETPDEYTLVYNAYNTLLAGGKLDQSVKKLIDVNAIPVPGTEHNDFFVEDNFNLASRVQGADRTRDRLTMYRHNLKLSGGQILYGNPLDTSKSAMHQLLAQGQHLDALVTMHHHMAVGAMTADGSWAHSTAGLLKPGADALEYTGEVYGNKGPHTRQITSRRALSVPGAEIHEDTADGRHIVHFMNDELLNLAHKSKERVTIAQFIDWQTGSVTMRPDYQIKFLDMVKQKLLNNEKVYIYWGGDIIQGRNYPGMPNENARIGLIKIEDQKEFVLGMLTNMLNDIPADKRRNVVGVSILPGNHEWNSKYADTGDAHIGYLVDYMKNWLGEAYSADDVKKMVLAHKAMRTYDGSFMDVFSGTVEVAGYNVYLSHLLLERGAKGGTGDPINQFDTVVEGQSGLMKDINLALFGHWHHPQYKVVNGKVGIISGSMAGESGYEQQRGYRAAIGGVFTNLGGGLPPSVEFVGQEALENHVIKNGYYSEQQLARRGVKTDSNYQPIADGFIPRRRDASSALQRELWNEIDEILNSASSTMGHN